MSHLESAAELFDVIAVKGVHTLPRRKGQSVLVTKHLCARRPVCVENLATYLQLDGIPSISSFKDGWQQLCSSRKGQEDLHT